MLEVSFPGTQAPMVVLESSGNSHVTKEPTLNSGLTHSAVHDDVLHL